MKTLATWTPPVAVSLLLHATLLVLVAYQMSAAGPDRIQLQTISVELLGNTSTIENKPQVQAEKPPRPEPVPIVNAVPQESQTVAATPEQTSTTNQEASSATETKPSALVVQPLGKLSRPPAFLRKIDPVYPASEQRAGTQAYVLAEITIDAQGSVLDIKIIKSAGSAFDNAVTEALKKSIFVPGYMGKEAVAVRVLVPFRFNLR